MVRVYGLDRAHVRTHGGATTHPRWYIDTPTVAQRHTHGGTATHPRWYIDTPTVVHRHTQGGAATHPGWYIDTPRVAQRHTQGGTSTHPRWYSDTPMVAQRHTFGGTATHPGWCSDTLRVVHRHTQGVHVRPARAAALQLGVWLLCRLTSRADRPINFARGRDRKVSDAWRLSAVQACWIAHQTCTGAGVELAPPAAGIGVCTPPREIIYRKCRRVAEASSRWPPRTCRRVVTSPPA
jgi:hypothetical protein